MSGHLSSLMDGTKHFKGFEIEDGCAVSEMLKSLFRCSGSVIPRSVMLALPCACLACGLKIWQSAQEVPTGDVTVFTNSAAYTGFSFAMGFLFVFRTSQAYSRYWSGVSVTHRLYAEWLEFASSAIAFTRFSQASAEDTQAWQHRLVRLLSLLHAVSSASLRAVNGSTFELIDIQGLEAEQLSIAASSPRPTTLIFQWILELVVEGQQYKILAAPPPIVSRAFQEFTSGMVAFHDASNIKINKFPFQYTQMATILLVVHWCVTPFVMCQWTKWPSWVFMFTFVQVLIFWGLYFTAVEIENPFKLGSGAHNFAAHYLQRDFNEQLLTIIDPKTRNIPQLSQAAVFDIEKLSGSLDDCDISKMCACAGNELVDLEEKEEWQSDACPTDDYPTNQATLPKASFQATGMPQECLDEEEIHITVQPTWEVLKGQNVQHIVRPPSPNSQVKPYGDCILTHQSNQDVYLQDGLCPSKIQNPCSYPSVPPSLGAGEKKPPAMSRPYSLTNISSV